MSIEEDRPLGEILVMFPASKNFVPDSCAPDPVIQLKSEISKENNFFERKLKIEVPNDNLSMRQITQGLEMRILMLDDICDRFNFYLDDLEMQLTKK